MCNAHQAIIESEMNMNRDNEVALTQLLHGTVQVTPVDQLKKKLATGKSLTIKLGMDPTAPDLHLGHVVVLSKMRQFQDLGHTVIFLIGDYTARIGDPTGKSKTRPPLTEEEIARNTQSYFEQVSRILDAQKVKVVYNSTWLDKLTSADMLKICARTTLAQLIERDDFQKRMTAQEPIAFHELFYPIMQGYDSVELKADVELGGTDQTFNLMMGRHLQESYGQEPQVIITMPLLEGLDGVQKMSKSLGNAVGIAEPADQAYGKLMSISDQLMWRYLLLLVGKTDADIKQLQEDVAAGTLHPMTLKKQMAHAIVKKFWSMAEAEQAQSSFEALFQKKDYSKAQEATLPEGTENPLWVIELLKLLGAISSSSEGRRLIEAKAVSINEESITDFKALIGWSSGMIVKVGKHRIYKLG